eukprot:m.333497 g.333497  ORF g.333497 m.333497 type:complete len:451 (+) comp17156_c0_seq1:91-1443(+)
MAITLVSLAVLLGCVIPTSATEMCATHYFGGDDVHFGYYHVQEEGLAVFPCIAKNQTKSTKIGSLDNLYLIRPQVPKTQVREWMQEVKKVSDVKVVFTAKKKSEEELVLVLEVSNKVALDNLPSRSFFASIPSAPIPPVDEKMRSKLVNIASNLQVDPVIQNLVNQVTSTNALTYLNYLTGVTSDIKSRNSIHPDGGKAALYLQEELKKYGFNTELETFNPQYTTPNVVAIKPGEIEPNTIVVVGAHYDSRGPQRSSSTSPAPGANDDGSGTSALLQLAKIIYEQGIDFKYTLMIAAFGGEEQGLVGSRALAKSLKDKNTDILAMLQSDMTAYRVPTEGIQCGFPASIQDPILTDLAKDTLELYTPNVETCTTTACCSDHQSFYEQGYSATQFFERCGSIADPEYHSLGDVVRRSGFDIDGQLVSLTKGMIATAAVLLEPQEVKAKAMEN